MRKLLSIMVLMIMGLAVNAQTPQPQTQPQTPVESAVKFDKTLFDFGEIEYGADGSHSFTFKNVSKNPVAIKDVGTSCGCTTPSYSKEPIMPGKSGNVTARYDTSRIGPFSKTLTVYINDETIVLSIKGTVKPPKSEETK